MPHISVTGCHINRQISEINIHAEIKFSRETWVNRPKANMKMDELREKLEALLMEYFDVSEVSSEIYSNHEWNSRMSNH